jgi:hypothetical protein
LERSSSEVAHDAFAQPLNLIKTATLISTGMIKMKPVVLDWPAM